MQSKVEDITVLLQSCFDNYKNRPLFGEITSNSKEKSGDSIEWTTYDAVYQRLLDFGTGLSDIQKRGEFLGICGGNSTEWILADLSATLFGYTTISFDHTFTDPDLYVPLFERYELNTLVCSEAIFKKIRHVISGCSKLAHVIVWGVDPEWDGNAEVTATSVRTFENVEERGRGERKALGEKYPAKHPDGETLTIVHTASTGSTAKGVCITARVWLERILKPLFWDNISPLKYLSHHPLHHITDRMTIWNIIVQGGQTVFYDPAKSVIDVWEVYQVVRPTFVWTVPRMCNTVYANYKNLIREKQDTKSQISNYDKYPRALQKCRDMFGGKVMMIGSGSAPSNSDVHRFMKRLFPSFIDGYGTTEAHVIAVDGVVFPFVQYKIEEMPELANNENQDQIGEICIKSPYLFSGYFKDEGHNKDYFTDDGFFKLGDIVTQTQDGKIQIIGRKDGLTKLSQGEYVDLETLSTVFDEAPLIQQCFVYAKATWSFVVAIVVPNEEFYDIWKDQKRVKTELSIEDKNEATSDPYMKKRILFELAKMSMKKKLKSFEVPRNVYIEAQPFTISNSRLTSNNKLQRAVIARDYDYVLQELYTRAEPGHVAPAKVYEEATTLQKLLQHVVKIFSVNILEEMGEQYLKDMSVVQLGIDSLGGIRLASIIQSEFGIKIPMYILTNDHTTLADIASLIDHPETISLPHRLHPRQPCSLYEDLLADAEYQPLTNNISDFPNIAEICANPRHVLLTGVTGFLGCHLLEALLERTDAEIYCLVRGCHRKTAEERLRASIGCLNNSRVHVINGDLINFNLNQEEYTELARKIDTIYHSAAMINHVLPYVSHKESNVMGTRYLIQFALTEKRKIFHYISTVGVITRDTWDRDGKILETETGSHVAELNGYQQSKWVAERMLINAGRNVGLPYTIFRPGFISAHTKTGRCNPVDVVSTLVSTIVESKNAPNINSPIDLSPVNFVSNSIVHVARNARALGKYFHVLSPSHAIPFKELTDALVEFGYEDLKLVKYDEWVDVLERDHTLKYGHTLVRLLSAKMGEETERLDRKNFMEMLEGFDFEKYKMTRNAFFAYFMWMVENGVMEKPSASGKVME